MSCCRTILELCFKNRPCEVDPVLVLCNTLYQWGYIIGYGCLLDAFPYIVTVATVPCLTVIVRDFVALRTTVIGPIIVLLVSPTGF